MPGAEYYRRQAQLCAKLAAASSDPSVISRYTIMALEHLARAEEIEPSGGAIGLSVGAGGSDMDRD
jgi:hypothetical protein